jgi:hypothetical protein
MTNKELKEQIVEALEPEEIQELREQIKEKKEELEELGDWEMDECDVDEYLDGSYPDVDLAGVKYSFSQVLKDTDPGRYDDFKTDIESQQREEQQEELEDELEDLEDQLEELLENPEGEDE